MLYIMYHGIETNYIMLKLFLTVIVHHHFPKSKLKTHCDTNTNLQIASETLCADQNYFNSKFGLIK